MVYLVHVTERVVATLEVEARNKTEAIAKASDGDILGRDDWDRSVVEAKAERKAQ